MIQTKNKLLNGNGVKYSSPEDIVQQAVAIAKRPILTTKFGPHSACLIDVVMNIMPDMPVLWVDTGFNTAETYAFVERLQDEYDLNLKVYRPRQNYPHAAPAIDSPEHDLFTQKVKIEPFRRAIRELNPDVWITNLRKGQTAHRNKLDVFHRTDEGILKVCPFYYWTEEEIEDYLFENNLPHEFNYFDPTKVLENRECGIHLQEDLL